MNFSKAGKKRGDRDLFVKGQLYEQVGTKVPEGRSEDCLFGKPREAVSEIH